MQFGQTRRLLFSLLLFAVAGLCAFESRADLILANFSSTNLLKIMPVGDSITDDCSTNGAWRLFLQPMLETNGVAFTNTGRNVSVGYPGFTKRRHEGYCGTVIGPPGVYAVYGYSTTNAYLEKIITDALAITNYRPHLVLLLIGANDIGRGRNPWSVATNDMPALLNIIFSNVPNANVFLAKMTTLQNASLGYGSFAINVPIYNAALQKMVNDRRALGQNVFLADMFSAVDYGTGFLSDHLHPNPVGLKAIAQEWAARVETILVRTNRLTSLFVHGGDEWKFADSGEDLGTAWVDPAYDDSAWNTGIGRFGYGEPATTATIVNYGPEATNKFTTTYFRRCFVVPWNVVITNLNVRLACADGAAVWLNGQELYRTNLPAGPLSYSTLALARKTGFTPHIYYPTNAAINGLPAGTNYLAVEVHQSSPTNSLLGFDMEVIGSGYVLTPPALSLAPSGTDLVLTWPVAGSAGYNLFSTTNLADSVPWTAVASGLQTNGSQIVVTQTPDAATRFYRLSRPVP